MITFLARTNGRSAQAVKFRQTQVDANAAEAPLLLPLLPP
jgi:hypothetical protein